MEAAHEEVAQGRALNNGLAADEVAAAANRDTAVAGISHVLAALEQLAEVAEPGSAVGVSKEGELAARMPQTVRYTAALAAVARQRHKSQHVVQFVLPRKVQHHLLSPIP